MGRKSRRQLLYPIVNFCLVCFTPKLPKFSKKCKITPKRPNKGQVKYETAATSYSYTLHFTYTLLSARLVRLLPALLAVLLNLLEELGELRVRLEHGLPDLERLRAAEAQLRHQRVRRLPV